MRRFPFNSVAGGLLMILCGIVMRLVNEPLNLWFAARLVMFFMVGMFLGAVTKELQKSPDPRRHSE